MAMDTSWMAEGLCNNHPPAVFFPSDGVGVEIAKKICAECPVKSECLEYALTFRIDHGVWDGPFIEYHTNGRKSSEVTFVKGLRQGVMTVYDQEGKAAFKTDYIDGVEQP